VIVQVTVAVAAGSGAVLAVCRVITPVPFTGTWDAHPLPSRWQAGALPGRWAAAVLIPRWGAVPMGGRWAADPLPSRWKAVMQNFTPIAAISVVYIPVLWTTELAGTEIDPTGQAPSSSLLPVQFAVPVSSGNPLAPAEASVWYSAVWLTGANIAGFVAQCLVGPTSSGGLVQLTAGTTYDLWSRIEGTPEQPTIFAGQQAVY
jgi:hypothetical protein